MNNNLILVLSIIFFIVITSYGIVYVIDNRLSNITINIPKQNINLKINKKNSNIKSNNKKGFITQTKPLNFDNRPLINPVSKIEIPKQSPIKNYSSNKIPKCSS